MTEYIIYFMSVFEASPLMSWLSRAEVFQVSLLFIYFHTVSLLYISALIFQSFQFRYKCENVFNFNFHVFTKAFFCSKEIICKHGLLLFKGNKKLPSLNSHSLALKLNVFSMWNVGAHLLPAVSHPANNDSKCLL